MAAELQRSSISFRRQGSSGLVWDDRFLSGDFRPMNHHRQNRHQHLFYSGEFTRPNRGGPEHHLGGSSMPDNNNNHYHNHNHNLRPIRTGRPPASDEDLYKSRQHDNAGQQDLGDPPSPKLSACGCCGGFGRSPSSGGRPRTTKPRSA